MALGSDLADFPSPYTAQKLDIVGCTQTH